jgi:hypothetical protein
MKQEYEDSRDFLEIPASNQQVQAQAAGSIITG